MNVTSAERIAQIGEMVAAGRSIRQIVAAVGVAKNTAVRHRRLIVSARPALALVRCGCGALAGHQGWCARRVANSPARQRFLARWSRTPLVIIKRGARDEISLYADIRRAIPSHLDSDLRDDIQNDVAVAVLSGQIRRSEIGAKIKAFITAARRFTPNSFRDISIDAPLNADGLTFSDILRAPDEYEEEEAA